jgi:hypothetical protein
MSWKVYGRKRFWPNFKGISQHLPGRTEEYHEKPQSGMPVSRPRYEPGISRIRTANHSTTTFGALVQVLVIFFTQMRCLCMPRAQFDNLHDVTA